MTNRFWDKPNTLNAPPQLYKLSCLCCRSSQKHLIFFQIVDIFINSVSERLNKHSLPTGCIQHAQHNLHWSSLYWLQSKPNASIVWIIEFIIFKYHTQLLHQWLHTPSAHMATLVNLWCIHCFAHRTTAGSNYHDNKHSTPPLNAYSSIKLSQSTNDTVNYHSDLCSDQINPCLVHCRTPIQLNSQHSRWCITTHTK
jgi:hypothetical protein